LLRSLLESSFSFQTTADAACSKLSFILLHLIGGSERMIGYNGKLEYTYFYAALS
jgi:hypothetical protein